MKQNLKGMKVIAFNGAALRVTNSEGEILGEISLPAGPVDLTAYAPLTAMGDVEATGVFIASNAAGRLKTYKSERHTESAAASEYHMPYAQQQEMMMERMVERVVKRQTALEASRRADAVNKKPVMEEQAPVIEETEIEEPVETAGGTSPDA